ncbi:MAG: methylenetetrahydrofolate reductase C-terminal domain-containing protein, partial [Thermodesulforhabdaceae bacterium]
MVVAERKPIQEIMAMVAGYNKILLVGCKGCVTVCCAGGTKEVGVLASALRIARAKEGKPLEVIERTLERQCDPEYIEQVADVVEKDGVEAILSMA